MNKKELILFFQQNLQCLECVAGIQLPSAVKNELLNSEMSQFKKMAATQYQAAIRVLILLQTDGTAAMINPLLVIYHENYQALQVQYNLFLALAGIIHLPHLILRNIPDNFFMETEVLLAQKNTDGKPTPKVSHVFFHSGDRTYSIKREPYRIEKMSLKIGCNFFGPKINGREDRDYSDSPAKSHMPSLTIFSSPETAHPQDKTENRLQYLREIRQSKSAYQSLLEHNIPLLEQENSKLEGEVKRARLELEELRAQAKFQFYS